MGIKSEIAWTDSTWNPIRGCTKISVGCMNCYAEKVAARFCGKGMPYEGTISEGKWSGNVVFVKEHLKDPIRWKRPRKIFVNSMSDLFHESLSDEQILAIFEVMFQANHHTFQILTKRAKRMNDFCNRFRWYKDKAWMGGRSCAVGKTLADLPHIWLGVTAENQWEADQRIPLLLHTNAAVRMVSVEPMLERVSITKYLQDLWRCQCGTIGGPIIDDNTKCRCGDEYKQEWVKSKLDWVICGGESGAGARKMIVSWASKRFQECDKHKVPFFFKQHSGVTKESRGVPTLFGREIREFPEAK